MSPFNDIQPPSILDVHLCDDDQVGYGNGAGQSTDPWQNCTEELPYQCHTVSGAKDIVVKIEDRHHSAPSTSWDDLIAPRRLRYRVCPAGLVPLCDPWVVAYDLSGGMSGDWLWGAEVAKALYSLRSDFVTSSNYCACVGDEFWFVPTNTLGDPAGAWDTSGLSGFFSVTIEAEDHSGNVTTKTVPVCAGVFGKIVIRDCLPDSGGEPSDLCLHHTWLSSPDLVVKRSGDEPPPPPEAVVRTDVRDEPAPPPPPVEAGEELSVQVCMTNMGNAPIMSDTPITVAIFAGDDPSAFFSDAPPGHVEQTVRASALTTREGVAFRPFPWNVREERCGEFTLASRFVIQPDSVEGLSLFAVVSTPSDHPRPVTHVKQDNNIAQKALTEILADLSTP
jgi:hypothetical protein